MWSQSLLSAALLLVLPSPELASPHLFPASTYPLGSLHYQPLHPVYYNGFYSPWNTFQTAVQAASAPAWQTAPAWQAARVTSEQGGTEAAARVIPPSDCGTWKLRAWTAEGGGDGCYKYFGTTEKKSWEAARQQCREEGNKEGVLEADLAYFETKAELEAVLPINPPSDSSEVLVTDETTWLRGKMEGADVKVLKKVRVSSGSSPDTSNSEKWEWQWTTLVSLPTGIDWEGSKPEQDINTDRKLFIKKSSKKLGVEKGSYEEGFLCEFKKKACPDSTWTLDNEQINRRCLKIIPEDPEDPNSVVPMKQTWQAAYDYCKSKGWTLVKLAPKMTTELKDLITDRTDVVGIWVNEFSIKDQSKTFLVNEDGTKTEATGFGDELKWAVGYEKSGTGPQRVFLNKDAKLAKNDGTGLGNVMCQRLLEDQVSFPKPLVRSLL